MSGKGYVIIDSESMKALIKEVKKDDEKVLDNSEKDDTIDTTDELSDTEENE